MCFNPVQATQWYLPIRFIFLFEFLHIFWKIFISTFPHSRLHNDPCWLHIQEVSVLQHSINNMLAVWIHIFHWNLQWMINSSISEQFVSAFFVVVFSPGNIAIPVTRHKRKHTVKPPSSNSCATVCTQFCFSYRYWFLCPLSQDYVVTEQHSEDC